MESHGSHHGQPQGENHGQAHGDVHGDVRGTMELPTPAPRVRLRSATLRAALSDLHGPMAHELRKVPSFHHVPGSMARA